MNNATTGVKTKKVWSKEGKLEVQALAEHCSRETNITTNNRLKPDFT
jgi:hypothetical protein